MKLIQTRLHLREFARFTQRFTPQQHVAFWLQAELDVRAE
jgi:hypothetical protein